METLEQGTTPHTIMADQPAVPAAAPVVSDFGWNLLLLLALVAASLAFDVYWKKRKSKPSRVECVRHHTDHMVPKRAKKGDAGFDLFCDEDVTIPVDAEASISQGINVKIPDGAVGLILPRSSANKLGLHVKIGVIDSGYTGPLFALVHNIGQKPVEIKRGMRICQILPFALHPVYESMNEVTALPITERGVTGFGSTGDAAKHAA